MTRAAAREPLLAGELMSLQAQGVLHVSLHEAARALGSGEALVRRQAALGELPVRCFRVGRTYRVVLADLIDLLAPQTVTTGVAAPVAVTAPDDMELTHGPEDARNATRFRIAS